MDSKHLLTTLISVVLGVLGFLGVVVVREVMEQGDDIHALELRMLQHTHEELRRAPSPDGGR